MPVHLIAQGTATAPIDPTTPWRRRRPVGIAVVLVLVESESSFDMFNCAAHSRDARRRPEEEGGSRGLDISSAATRRYVSPASFAVVE